MEVGDWSIPTSTDVGNFDYTDLHFLISGYISIAYRVSHATLANATYLGHIYGEPHAKIFYI